MNSEFPGRYFPTILLVFLLSISIFLLTLRLDQRIESFKNLLLYFIFPSIETSNKVLNYGFVVSDNVYNLLKVQQENARLKEENDQLVRWKTDFEEIFTEYQRLKDLLVLQKKVNYKTTAAKLIGRDSSEWFSSCIINKGSADGVNLDDSVIAVQGMVSGLVGRVIEVTPNTSKILFLIDGLSSIAASCRRSGDDGIIQGKGTSELLLKYIIPKADIRPEDKIVTAGTGGIFPAGLVVGEVSEVTPENLGGFREAKVNPTINFNRLREVLVLSTAKKEGFQ
ncbi:MAG: rod shape-determining protein MreC [bacterium]